MPKGMAGKEAQPPQCRQTVKGEAPDDGKNVHCPKIPLRMDAPWSCKLILNGRKAADGYSGVCMIHYDPRLRPINGTVITIIWRDIRGAAGIGQFTALWA
ncbi:hypothetical protein JCM17846_06080 [Iodidimonas nitroreducens]|uniref:Uncharacterized protein n=1 Tax=Iodidimonas nitroreducens TaxID=1236968 RepID=A0A5A7N7C7_9PROT|nr:hypothetical protein JCM17846_06080 [Iodidimonas nitroreducens]